MGCTFCSDNLDRVVEYNWHVPNLGTRNIGFAVCRECGLVQQNPALTQPELDRYYKEQAVYTNPGRGGEPDPRNVAMVNEQLNFIKRGLGFVPKKILQIGSSDGYTLSVFKKNGAQMVSGIEPTVSSCEFAKEKYQIDCVNSSIENYELLTSFNLILLTHVLEHVTDPLKVLKKCKESQKDLNKGYIYVEVPLLDFDHALCPGFFSMEHKFYFSRNKINRLIHDAGYLPISHIEHSQAEIYPIIGILACSSNFAESSNELKNEYLEAKNFLTRFFSDDLKYWQECYSKILPILSEANNLYVWGAGAHTSQLFSNTQLLSEFNLAGILDSSEDKWGLNMGNWTCLNPKEVRFRSGDVILISSYNSENEIYESTKKLREEGVKTIKFHSLEDSL